MQYRVFSPAYDTFKVRRFGGGFIVVHLPDSGGCEWFLTDPDPEYGPLPEFSSQVQVDEYGAKPFIYSTLREAAEVARGVAREEASEATANSMLCAAEAGPEEFYEPDPLEEFLMAIDPQTRGW